MSFLFLFRTSLIAAAMVSFSGCFYSPVNSGDDDANVSEVDQFESPTKVQKLSKNDQPESEPLPSTPLKGVLELKLTQNEPFPLTKTVEQRLTETDGSGNVTVSFSRSEMKLSLNADEVYNDGRKKMTVRYHRVQYEEDIRGTQSAYSSDVKSDSIPRNCLLYAGLVDNAFSFVIGPNNKVIELVDFRDFLQRCLRRVPQSEVSLVRMQLESATKGEDGIATFIDDSIGLLPYSNDPAHPGVEIKEGTKWELEPRHTDNPLPIYVTTTCILNELSPNSAEIGLAGRISGPPYPISKESPAGKLKILVKGGYCTGSCRVDRKTGLPTQSRIKRDLDLAMELPNGQKIQQSKETLSTVTSFLVAQEQSVMSRESHVRQVNLQNATGMENHRRVQQAVGTGNNPRISTDSQDQ